MKKWAWLVRCTFSFLLWELACQPGACNHQCSGPIHKQSIQVPFLEVTTAFMWVILSKCRIQFASPPWPHIFISTERDGFLLPFIFFLVFLIYFKGHGERTVTDPLWPQHFLILHALLLPEVALSLLLTIIIIPIFEDLIIIWLYVCL